MQIHPLFPIPVVFFNLGRTLDSEEFIFLREQPTRQSVGNRMTTDVEILNDQKLSKLKDWINECLQKYLDNIYIPKTHCSLEITQSWVNFTEPGGYHHRHDHPNSLISGVFYISVDRENDSIFFFNRDFRQIQIAAKEHNIFNSDSWQFNINDGDLILFPSSLQHMVMSTRSSTTRISLAFNSFIKGNIGDISGLTNLTIY